MTVSTYVHASLKKVVKIRDYLIRLLEISLLRITYWDVFGITVKYFNGVNQLNQQFKVKQDHTRSEGLRHGSLHNRLPLHRSRDCAKTGLPSLGQFNVRFGMEWCVPRDS